MTIAQIEKELNSKPLTDLLELRDALDIVLRRSPGEYIDDTKLETYRSIVGVVIGEKKKV